MIIGGFEKLTLIDFPGEIAAIIFTQGCNFRCQFCYNPLLVWPLEDSKLKYRKDHSLIEEGDLFAFLESRKGKLDGVVITGGEPTLHPDLPEFIAKIKKLGYKVKLDTNGTNPEMLLAVLKHLDYIAMDLKAPYNKYEQVTGTKANLANIKKSVKIIMESGLPYEFRTTVVPGLIKKDDIREMGEILRGADKWYLQFFKSDIDLVSRELEGKDKLAATEMQELAEMAGQYVKHCEIRG